MWRTHCEDRMRRAHCEDRMRTQCEDRMRKTHNQDKRKMTRCKDESGGLTITTEGRRITVRTE